ncbi:hypothetical protein SJI19_16695 [Acerihabitans sp. TG2]|uniref:hypothetical protein n=1 Tax=Acerihabitans sp. TG2 TaxID=3096008 RepID=UPI002B237D33|nr:hypothetical protein [Acerihabitans sp. TG2]MEA9392164.1 hypothetical protein [Acerihabitans sp. TG2]
MPVKNEIKHKLIREFSNADAYSGMNALELSQKCCEQLALLGEPLPGWQEIREIIGKGSATDVNKGKHLYQERQGKLLSQLAEMPGVTEDMVELMMQLRKLAFSVATKSFAEKVQNWESLVTEANRLADESDDRYEAAIRERDSWQRQTQDRQALIDNLSEQLEDNKRAKNAEVSRLETALREARSQAEEANQLLENALNNLETLKQKSEGTIDRLKANLTENENACDRLKRDKTHIEEKFAAQATELAEQKAMLTMSEQRAKELEISQKELITSSLQKDERIAEKDRRYEITLQQLDESRQVCSTLETTLAAERHSSKTLTENNDALTKQIKKSEQHVSKLLTALNPKNTKFQTK